MDANYDKQNIEAAFLIMRAMHAIHPDVFQSVIGDIKNIIDEINRFTPLLDRDCVNCNKRMSFFDWHLAQGMCSNCAKEIPEDG